MANALKKKRYSKQQRQAIHNKTFTFDEMVAIRQKERDQANKHAFESLAPLFCLYLVENFRCRNNGVWKFMTWFNKMMEWLDKYPEGFEEIKQDLEKKAGVTIEY